MDITVVMQYTDLLGVVHEWNDFEEVKKYFVENDLPVLYVNQKVKLEKVVVSG